MDDPRLDHQSFEELTRLNNELGRIQRELAKKNVALEREMSERRVLEGHLREVQKMEAVGTLAGGLAHDINNLLQAVLSQSQLVRSASSEAPQALAAVEEIEQLIDRGAALTRQLLLFSRRQAAVVERLDINEVVRSSAQMLERLLRENISFETDLAPTLSLVDADRGQLVQVLINLVVNASDAMPEGGRLVVSTVEDDQRCVVLAVEDSGCGISPEVRERIFEPFFTTKGVVSSTGLGLSVVHGIVSQLGGRVEVESTVGKGSLFRVLLPGAAGGAPAAAQSPSPADELGRGNGERVLVVEDEEAAREGLWEFLTMLGYEVTAVGTGEEAIELTAGPPFHLLLTDLMLPGVAGSQVAASLQKDWPSLKVILMSGYAEDEAVRRIVESGDVRFLHKPFAMRTLAREMRAALEE